MALPAFDPTKHHVGLGSSVGTKKGFIIAGDYREMLQNSPRISSFGSLQELFAAPSLSRWTQDNFLGGCYWPDWQPEDNAVFGSSLNILPAGQGRSLRTTPPLVLYDDETGGSNPGSFFSALPYGSLLISTWATRTVKLDVTTGTRTETAHPSAHSAVSRAAIEAGQLDAAVLWTPTTFGGSYYFQRRKVSDWGALTTYNAPAGVGQTTGMEFGGVVPVVCFGSTVYSCVLAAADATQPTFTKIDRLPGRWIASCAHGGMAVILCGDSQFKTYVCQTDGSTIQTLVEFPYNFSGRAICSYGGRLYVLGTDYDWEGQESYVGLYEITGSSLRVIKTFAPERRVSGTPTPGVTDLPITGDSLAVHEGLLYLGVISRSLIAYDVVNDGLYAGPALQDITQDPYVNSGGESIRFYYGAGASTNNWQIKVELTNVTDYVVQSGDYLEYDVFWAPSGATQNKKLDFQLRCSDTTDSINIGGSWVDQNAIAGAGGDISSYASNQWYSRKLALPAGWVGKTVSQPYILGDLDTVNEAAVAYFRNVRITNGSGTVRKQIYQAGDAAAFSAFAGGPSYPTLVPYWSATLQAGSASHEIAELFTFRGRLTAFVIDPTAATHGYHYVARTSGEIDTSYQGEVITSDFGPEPGLDKRWSQLHLLTRYGSSNPTIDYSTDAGATWVSATVTHSTSGVNRTSIADLSSAPVSRSIRFRIRLPRGTNVTDFTELRAFTLGFSFLESGKRSWSFTINSVASIEDVGGDTLLQDVSEIHDQLWAWASTQTSLFFTDLDGEAYKVSLVNLQHRNPQIGPIVDGTIREAFFTLTLVEA